MLLRGIECVWGLCAAALLAGSCASLRAANAPAPPPTPPPLVIEKRTAIDSYTTRDGQRHAWVGTVEPQGGDSLLFQTRGVPASGLSNGAPAQRRVVARGEVVAVARANPTASIFGVLIFGALAAVLVIYAAGATSFAHY